MALRLPDWLIEAAEYPWRTRLTFAAVWGPDMHEGRIPISVLVRKTRLSHNTIRPALYWMEAAGWIERERGHSTATTNPLGKLYATGKLLAVNPLLLTGSFTVIGAKVYDRLDTAAERWDALRAASRERANWGLVTFGTDTEVACSTSSRSYPKEILPKDVLRTDVGRRADAEQVSSRTTSSGRSFRVEQEPDSPGELRPASSRASVMREAGKYLSERDDARLQEAVGQREGVSE